MHGSPPRLFANSDVDNSPSKKKVGMFANEIVGIDNAVIRGMSQLNRVSTSQLGNTFIGLIDDNA